jgi:hypothetical protein
MTTFIEYVQQVNKVNTYRPGRNICNSGNCSGQKVIPCDDCDWAYDTETCGLGCNDQLICSKLDTVGGCPNLGPETLVDISWGNPDGICDNDGTIRCEYDASNITTFGILKYQDTFCTNVNCEGNKNFNEIIMPDFCTNETAICTDDLIKCPNFMSRSEAGNLCKSWASENNTISDDTINNYCINADTNVCGCVNRRQDPVYNYIKRGLKDQYLDSCWYNLCTDIDTNLITSDLVGDSCNMDTICTSINNIIKTTPTKLSVSQLQAGINCDITETPPLLVDDLLRDTPVSNNFIWIILIIVFVFIILIIILLFAYMSRNKK